jgi:hypothetical protein
MIVSVSRRCDIPRFQFKWFMERLDAGFCEVVNPYNCRQIKRVSLVPAREGMGLEEGVDLFVFWTRDPRHILAEADELTERGFRFYVMVTVTGYPSVLEPSMVRTSKVLTAIKELAKKIGLDRIIWRYDPVILTNVTDEAFHRANFDSLARELAGSVKRVIISIYDEYKEPKKRLEAMEKTGGLKMLDTGGIFPELLAGFAKNAEAAGMEIQSCAEEEDFSSFGIKGGACIDTELINRLWGIEFSGKDKSQRPNCLCCKSVDIGTYGICGAHCVYCYAWR